MDPLMRPLPLLVLLFTLTFVASGLVSSFDGFDGAQVPIPQEDPPIQPPGWAFAVWGVIYAGLVLSAVVGLWRWGADPGWDRARLPLLASLALGTPWLAIAARSAVWATVLIFAMAGAAIAAFLAAPSRDRWLLRVPVGLYAGWLTAASFVALGSTMAGFGVLTGPLGWAFIGTILALLVALAVQWLRPGAWEYGLTVAWALLTVAVKDAATHPGVALLAAGGAALVMAAALARRPADVA